MKEVDIVHMKRLVIMIILKMCGEVLLFTIVPGIVIRIIGNINKWNSPLPYSNAFFIAGCLMIAAGAFSRLSAGGEWKVFQQFSAESFRGMSSSEQRNFIINISGSVRLVVLGLLSGILLILISIFLAKMD